MSTTTIITTATESVSETILLFPLMIFFYSINHSSIFTTIYHTIIKAYNYINEYFCMLLYLSIEKIVNSMLL